MGAFMTISCIRERLRICRPRQSGSKDPRDSSQSQSILRLNHIYLLLDTSYDGNMSKNEQKEHLLPFHRESSDDDSSELDGPYGRGSV